MYKKVLAHAQTNTNKEVDNEGCTVFDLWDSNSQGW